MTISKWICAQVGKEDSFFISILFNCVMGSVQDSSHVYIPKATYNIGTKLQFVLSNKKRPTMQQPRNIPKPLQSATSRSHTIALISRQCSVM